MLTCRRPSACHQSGNSPRASGRFATGFQASIVHPRNLGPSICLGSWVEQTFSKILGQSKLTCEQSLDLEIQFTISRPRWRREKYLLKVARKRSLQTGLTERKGRGRITRSQLG